MVDDMDRSGLAPAAHFPLTREVTYLNSAGIGLMAAPVEARTRAFASRLALEGTRAYFDNVEAIQIAPRIAAARLLGAEPSTIAIVNSVAEAMSQFAWSVRPREGQNVVLIDIDHPSATYPWLRVAAETTAEIRFVQVMDDPGSLNLARVAALVDHNTAVISVSHILWTSGFRFDLKALAQLAHAHGALLAVDASHSAGVVPLDVVDCEVDLLAATSFKWLCSYSGASICYVRPTVLELLHPVLVGGKSADREQQLRPAGYDARRIAFPEGASRLEYGSSSHVSRVALTSSIEYLLEIGIERIAGHAQALGSQLIDGLLRLGADVVTPQEAAGRGGIVTARFTGVDGVALTQALDSKNVIVLPRLGGIRFSPHLFNGAADVERAIDILGQALSRGT